MDGDWQGELDTAIMEDEEEENFVDASDGRRAEQDEQNDKGDRDEENEIERTVTVTVTRKRAEERQPSEETAQNATPEQKQEKHATDSDSPMGR